MRKITALFVFAALLISCSPSDDKAVAAKSVEEFHRRYNNLAFSEIYDIAHENVKNMISKEDFVESMKAMRQGQGAVLEAKEIGVAYNYSSEGNMVKMLYEVTYEKGKAKEEFIWHIINGKGVLSSYRFITS